MDMEPGIAEAAALFKVLGNESRLWLLRLLGSAPCTVTALVEATGMSQPLVSQHLRSLRQAGLVDVERRGKESVYHLADQHVIHVVGDALEHAKEPHDMPGSTVSTQTIRTSPQHKESA
jgi:DNA-binding transcriptional ArsR family regulator